MYYVLVFIKGSLLQSTCKHEYGDYCRLGKQIFLFVLALHWPEEWLVICKSANSWYEKLVFAAQKQAFEYLTNTV